jgi:xylan 1,4-beta-xylosidase
MSSWRVLPFVLVWLCLAAAGARAQAVYRNPVIAGDYPDPTVIRVGEDYWAAVTTGSWAPHFTLLRSRDLVNWQIAGAALARKPAWARGDFWAPELIEHAGRFYLYYTARRPTGLTSTTGRWSARSRN